MVQWPTWCHLRDNTCNSLWPQKPSSWLSIDCQFTTIQLPSTKASDLISDIIFWSEALSVILIELTVCFDTLYTAAKDRKHAKYMYAKLVASGRLAGYCCNLVTLEVGSRGYIITGHCKGNQITCTSHQSWLLNPSNVCASIKTAFTKSFDIWCSCNYHMTMITPPVLYFILVLPSVSLCMCNWAQTFNCAAFV